MPVSFPNFKDYEDQENLIEADLLETLQKMRQMREDIVTLIFNLEMHLRLSFP
jgi:hypothetical protein